MTLETVTATIRRLYSKGDKGAAHSLALDYIKALEYRLDNQANQLVILNNELHELKHGDSC